MSDIPDSLMVEAMETIFRSKAKFEFAGTEQIEVLARDIAEAILAERERYAIAEEPVGYLFQHDETGSTQIGELWFLQDNPRWFKVGPVYLHPASAEIDRLRQQLAEANETARVYRTDAEQMFKEADALRHQLAEAREKAMAEAATIARSFWGGHKTDPRNQGYDEACAAIAEEIEASAIRALEGKG